MTTPAKPPAGPPAGWYPSQNDPKVELFWDGSAWTGQTRPAAPSEPPPGTTVGTGPYSGLFWDGKRWIHPDGSPAVLATTAAAPGTSSRSTGRTIGGVAALLVAAVVAWLGWGWFQGFTDLQGQGNPFAGMLALFGLGAWVVAAAFGIWGVVLLSKK